MNPLEIAPSVRSDFSIGESSLQVRAMLDKAKELGIKQVALTDYMSLSSMPVFSERAKKAGVEPIVGCTLQIVADPTAKLKDKDNSPYRLKVYVKDDSGLRSLFAALSKSLTEDHYYYHARLGLEDVLALEGVVVTTGDIQSMWHHPDAREIHKKLLAKFGPDYYVELTAIDTPLFDRINQLATETALLSSLPSSQLIITRPAMYLTPDDADSTDVLRAITSNTSVYSKWLARPWARDLSLLAPKDLAPHVARTAKGAGISASLCLGNLETMFAKCAYRFTKLAPCLPKMADNEFAALMAAVKEGWDERFLRTVWGHKPSNTDLADVYRPRLKFELGVLGKMGFSGYFLLVQDIVRWSKANGVRVGPGRGSVGGSLVAYLMGITDIDPIRFDLLFERFINPDRTDLPDADLDFMSARRHEVVDYIIGKWGREHVAGIVNFSTLGPASALRDTARLHNLSPLDYACSKQMEKEHGVSLSLTESAERVPDIERFQKEHPIVWNHALRLEGANRSLSQHAAGVVVAGEPVTTRAVVSTRGGDEGLPVIQWDKSQVENFGLIKIDVLGLNTLDLIDTALSYIKERHFKDIDLLDLPLDDERVLDAFGRGDTTGVFQFTGGGMKKLLKDMATGGRLTFDDLCAATALFRPGPLDAGLCDRYVAVKKGETTPYYEHPLLEECLGDTFGVIVYQEQVMKICRVLCGFTPGEADGVRKAIGKKDAEKMAEYGGKFIAGAVASGMDKSRSELLWDTILGFAGYAFNKSHSAEYSLISWVTMWLKVYYPAEFFAAALTVIDKEDQLPGLVNDAQSKKLRVLPPSLLKSSMRVEIEGEDILYAPFQAIKGVSSNVATAIVKLRNFGDPALGVTPGTFTLGASGSVLDLEPTVQKPALGRTVVNARHRESLARVGALHSIDGQGVAPMHPSRLKDRLELIPGFTVDMVKPERGLNAEVLAKIEITKMAEEMRHCEGCSLKGTMHPLPRMGDKPKFMLVFDSPNWKEERAGRMLEGDAAEVVKAALKGVGLKASDGYYTSLVKSVKPKDQKALTNEQINGCSTWLAKEIELLKPPVIIAMGSNTVRYFSPGIKGTPTDLAGKVIFDAKLDASIIFGINPGSLFHDPSKIKYVEEVFAKLGDLLS